MTGWKSPNFSERSKKRKQNLSRPMAAVDTNRKEHRSSARLLSQKSDTFVLDDAAKVKLSKDYVPVT